MAPNATSSALVYENDDLELLPKFSKRGYRTYPILFVNGNQVPPKLASKARPNQTLLSFLRDVLGLTGSKLGCAEGGCGACTVLVSKAVSDHVDSESGSDKKIEHSTVNACLMPVLAADGCHVTTVEGVGSAAPGKSLHPVQQAMVDMHGSQCGFCTPGIIMSLYGLLSNFSSVEHLEEHLDGNLCRCTGYRPIWDAARSLCDDAEEHLVKGPCGTACRDCPERDDCEQDCNVQDKAKAADKVCSTNSLDKVKEFPSSNWAGWKEQPDKMFPKELLELKEEPLMIVDKSEFHAAGTWLKPTRLHDLLALLEEFAGDCKIVVGNTEVGIEARFKHAKYPRLIAPSEAIESLFGFELSESGSLLTIGSCTPLSKIQKKCLSLASEASSSSEVARTVQPMHDMLRWFASTQIRNVACLGGNLVTASPISDMNPMLACMRSQLVIASLGTEAASADGVTVVRRKVPVSNFFLRYRTVDLKPNEMVEMIEVPVLRPYEFVKPFKQARRREDDISIVTSGMRIWLEAKPGDDGGSWYVKEANFAFGGMAPTTILATKTEEAIVGQVFNASTIEVMQTVLLEELALPADVPGGQASFRMTLAASFLFKFYVQVVQDLKLLVKSSGEEGLPPVPIVEDVDLSAAETYVSAQKPSITGIQTYPAPKVASGLESTHLKPSSSGVKENPNEVGRSQPHQSGPLHCTGEALYTDDIPVPASTLQSAFVLSTECGGTLEALDTVAAMSYPGVVGVYTYKDVAELGGDNTLGPIVHDEFCFLPVGEKVLMVNQVLGIVVAETLESAEEAARLVQATYGTPASKGIVSIEDAIEERSYYEMTRHRIERGDQSVISSLVEAPISAQGDDNTTITVEGSFRCGGQDHFYLETNACVVVPSEADSNLTIYCSTQAVNKTQNYCASTTNTPAHKVVVRMKRMGGGFGGKETRNVFMAAAVAVAAKRCGKPVRMNLPRDVDMSTTGGRHAFLAKYKASAERTEDGALKLQALKVQLYNNGGCGMDLSGPVMDRALFHVDGVYHWPYLHAEGVCCKTVQPPHTAFRGFGGPQGLSTAEHVLDHLATVAGVSVDQVRRSNMYTNGTPTHFGMKIGDPDDSGPWHVPTLWDRLYSELKVDELRVEIADFNSKNKWLKRGLAVLPTKFGIAFTNKMMNQGGALVHVYHADGTVLVSHGGTEMGQGLHTKVCQVAAQAFGIPLNQVYVNDTSSDKVANSQPTAASMSTDLYGMATLDACQQILKRLEPIRAKLGPEASLKEIAMAAWFERIDMSAHGFFRLADHRCGYNWDATATPPADASTKPDNAWRGHPFNYFTQGVAVSMVEIDVLTGNHRTLKSDVVVDVGSSINPSIDIGQIEGAFVQGMGWSTMEEVIYADDDHTWIRPRGKTFTTGPGTYKIPAFNDVPEEFNVSLMQDVENPFAVHSSKAIGEPPFFLGSSVFYAIKDAIAATRAEQHGGESVYFEMRMPATSERIRMLCADTIAGKALESTGPFRDGTELPADIRNFQPVGSH